MASTATDLSPLSEDVHTGYVLTEEAGSVVQELGPCLHASPPWTSPLTSGAGAEALGLFPLSQTGFAVRPGPQSLQEEHERPANKGAEPGGVPAQAATGGG